MSSPSNSKLNQKIKCLQIESSYHIDSKRTVYEIVLDTTYKQWTIRKRYSDFFALHSALNNSREKEAPSLLINQQDFDALPEIPPKRWFRGNSQIIVEERKIGLKQYLNSLFSSMKNMLHNTDIINFIEIEKELLLQLIQESEVQQINYSTATKSLSTNISSPIRNSYEIKESLNNNSTNLFSLRDPSEYSDIIEYNSKAIENLLRNLEENAENQSSVIIEFDCLFDQQMNNQLPFSENDIFFLFTGKNYPPYFRSPFQFTLKDKNTKTHFKGWWYHIGNYQTNKIGSEACLNFLSKVIKFECNWDYEKWLNVLMNIEAKYLNWMKLNKWIQLEANNSLVNKAFDIIKVLINSQFEFQKLFSFRDYEYIYERINRDCYN